MGARAQMLYVKMSIYVKIPVIIYEDNALPTNHIQIILSLVAQEIEIQRAR